MSLGGDGKKQSENGKPKEKQEIDKNMQDVTLTTTKSIPCHTSIDEVSLDSDVPK
jgi:hypothetical protein